MNHTRFACAIAFFSLVVALVGCVTDSDDSDVAEGGSAITYITPRPYPTAPKPSDPVEYVWESDGTVFDFDAYEAFGVNLIDPYALTVRVPYVYVGDTIRVEATGDAYAEHLETDVTCILQAHVTDGFGSEAPTETGGDATFVLKDADHTDVGIAGSHVATRDGTTRVRILGRVSRPDRFCGLMGAITIRATRAR